MSEPVAGNHNDLYEIEDSVDELFQTLEQAEIPTQGLFVNADAGHRGAILTPKAFVGFVLKKNSWPMWSLISAEES